MRGMIHHLYRVASVGQPIGPFEAVLRLVALGSLACGAVLMIIPSNRAAAAYAVLLGGFGFVSLAAGWKGYNEGPDGEAKERPPSAGESSRHSGDPDDEPDQ